MFFVERAIRAFGSADIGTCELGADGVVGFGGMIDGFVSMGIYETERLDDGRTVVRETCQLDLQSRVGKTFKTNVEIF